MVHTGAGECKYEFLSRDSSYLSKHWIINVSRVVPSNIRRPVGYAAHNEVEPSSKLLLEIFKVT